MMVDDQNQNDRDEQEAGVDGALNSYRQHHKETILSKMGAFVKIRLCSGWCNDPQVQDD